MNQPLGSSYLTAHSEKLPYLLVSKWLNQNKLGSNFVRPIEPINRLIQTQSKLLQYTKKKKIEKFLARKGVLSGGALGLNTLCKGCSSHTTLVGLLYPEGDKSEKVCTGYKVQPTKGLNLLKESECHALVQIVLCNFLIELIIFRSTILFLFVLFPLSFCLHQHNLMTQINQT